MDWSETFGIRQLHVSCIPGQEPDPCVVHGLDSDLRRFDASTLSGEGVRWFDV
jgi:hypothetical protein